MTARRRAALQVALPYTVERANQALPLVRRIAADLVRDYAAWQAAVSRFEYAAARSSADAPDPEAEMAQRDVQRLATEIDSFLRELDALGVEFRAYDTGLIDFPGELENRPVYLCWMLGEAAVEHWHDADAGFAGRQSLPSELLAR